MRRFFLPPEDCQSALLTLSEADAHHARSVLRIGKEEEAEVLDGSGRRILARVLEVSKRTVTLQPIRVERAAPLPCSLTLYQALPKGKLMEDIIEKATELGVCTIIPLLSERVISRMSLQEAREKQKKWQLVAIEAIKQCGSPWLPRVSVPAAIKEALENEPRRELELLGALEPHPLHIKTAVSQFIQKHGKQPLSAGFWIGPEGDFSDAERVLIKEAGALPVTLGPLVLRCETAAIYGLSVLNHEFQSLSPRVRE